MILICIFSLLAFVAAASTDSVSVSLDKIPLVPWRQDITEQLALSILDPSEISAELQFSYRKTATIVREDGYIENYFAFTFSTFDVNAVASLRASVYFMSEDFVLYGSLRGDLVLNVRQTRSPVNALTKEQDFCIAVTVDEPDTSSWSIIFTDLPWFVNPVRRKVADFVNDQLRAFVGTAVRQGLLDGAKAPFGAPSRPKCPRAPRTPFPAGALGASRRRSEAFVALGNLSCDARQFIFGEPFGGEARDVQFRASLRGNGVNAFIVDISELQLEAQGQTCAVDPNSQPPCQVRAENSTAYAEYNVVRLNATSWNVTLTADPLVNTKVTRCCAYNFCGIPTCSSLAKKFADDKFTEIMGFIQGPFSIHLVSSEPKPPGSISIGAGLAVLIILILVVLVGIFLIFYCCCCRKKGDQADERRPQEEDVDLERKD